MANEAINRQQISPADAQPRAPLTLVGRRREVSLDDYECFVGVSAQVAALKEYVAVQSSDARPALVIGERGLRQEKIARALHDASEGWALPFFAVNAHGLSDEALHNLLFGPAGVVETIRCGTIFINDLTGLPVLLQQRFAAYLEERRWHGRTGRFAEQRLVFSTELNPGERTADNRLAWGLVELLRPHSFSLKPLRERSEDIPYLARFLTARISKRLKKGDHEISSEAMQLLIDYHWEGNLDELESVLESAIAALPPSTIDESQLPSRIRHAMLKSIPNEGISLPQIVDDFERSLIETALRQSGGSQTKASRLLGLRVQTLNMKLKRFARH
jgi:DNA-binding NtrC family response regulator